MQFEDGKQAVQILLEKGRKFDAVFAASDYAAMGAINILKKKGIRIPEEVAVVGFMDEPFAEFTEPQLSSVRQSPVDMGMEAAQLFFKELRSEKVGKFSKKVIEPELKIRTSSLKKI